MSSLYRSLSVWHRVFDGHSLINITISNGAIFLLHSNQKCKLRATSEELTWYKETLKMWPTLLRQLSTASCQCSDILLLTHQLVYPYKHTHTIVPTSYWLKHYTVPTISQTFNLVMWFVFVFGSENWIRRKYLLACIYTDQRVVARISQQIRTL